MNSAMMKKNSDDGFSDVQGLIAVDEHVPTAGSVVWWRLSGTVEYETIKAAWKEAGLDEKELLSPCSATTALRRAVDELREKHMLVRPLPGRSNGFVIVRERVVDDEDAELGHDNIAKIVLDTIGQVVVTTLRAGSEETTQRILRIVRPAFEKHMNTLDTTDFSCWLVRMMPKLDAVSVREGGGVYFVPPAAVERVGAVVQVLKKVSAHVVNRMPAMRSEQAVEAILDAITQEAEREAASLERDLAKMTLGERGFENRVSHCDDVERKVARYEGLLGRKLDDVRQRLDDLRARLSLAVLKTQGTETYDGPSLADL